ncbi:MAG: M15 family metallopeptidase [Faecalibacterium sp.]
MNQQQPIHRRRLTRAEIRRRRRNRAIRRIAGLTLVVCVAVGGVSFLLSHRKAPVPTADAAGSAANSAASSLPSAAPSSKVESSKVESSTGSEAASESVESRDNLLGLTAAEAQAMLADPLMILVNHTNKMPENYTFETAECGSKTAVNKTLQTVACNAFLELQKAAAAENVTVWMQSGYRSVSYQTNLYEKKTNYYKQQGYDDAKAKEMAAAVVNPPGYSEHNCGLAADLNSPEHTGLDEGFENTAAFRWLCQHAGEYGFILRYPKGAEEKTEITYEPWHWRYVGVENAAKINASGLCFEDYIAALQQIAG